MSNNSDNNSDWRVKPWWTKAFHKDSSGLVIYTLFTHINLTLLHRISRRAVSRIRTSFCFSNKRVLYSGINLKVIRFIACAALRCIILFLSWCDALQGVYYSDDNSSFLWRLADTIFQPKSIWHQLMHVPSPWESKKFANTSDFGLREKNSLQLDCFSFFKETIPEAIGNRIPLTKIDASFTRYQCCPV